MATVISKSFKDISLSFNRHPITNDLLMIKNEDAIKKSVQNLVRTNVGERFFNSLLGTDINYYLFENISPGIDILIEEEITTLLKNFETRIQVQEVDAEVFPDSNELNIKISYKIVGLPLTVQNLEFILQPTRV